MSIRFITSPSAIARRDACVQFLRQRPADQRVLVIAPQQGSGLELVRDAAGDAWFGRRVVTLGRLAVEIATPALAASDRAPASGLALEAVAARVVTDEKRAGRLGRFADMAARPGFPRALVRTLAELRLEAVDSSRVPGDLAVLHVAYEKTLAASGLVDRAAILDEATRALGNERLPGCEWIGVPLVLIDVGVACAREAAFVAVLASRSPDVLVAAPTDDASVTRLRIVLDTEAVAVPAGDGGDGPGPDALTRLQTHLFTDASPPPAELDPSVALLSAPGESRECVEIARRIHQSAAAGVPFDAMAVLMRSGDVLRTRLVEALRRAGVPCWSARGARHPDPGGRAFLALLACASEGLSARRFAEYLSLGEVPRDPDASSPTGWAAPDDELLASDAPSRDAEKETPEAPAAHVPTPKRWEKLLLEAAVIKGPDRWQSRLGQLAKSYESQIAGLDDVDDPRREQLMRLAAALDGLRSFSAPLLLALQELADAAPWGAWIERLTELAGRALRDPARVRALLAELRPMADVGPVDLAEVRRVLERRLLDLVVPESGRRYGRVFVGPIEAARGQVFDVVFVPGLAERMFPRKVVEDPILLDDVRRKVSADLAVNETRGASERAALRLAVGSAQHRVVLSWSRLDEQGARARVPSFYGLEVLRAARGVLPGFDVLVQEAERTGRSRLGWPAPEDSADAIDDAEHDLALLRRVLDRPGADGQGTARYLLSANPHLARALRARGRRWGVRRYTVADGLLDPAPEARAALAAHALTERSFSATALQNFAACPYKFLLYTIHRLEPREEPESIEEIPPLQRGSLVHEVQYEFLSALAADDELPVRRETLDQARARLDAFLDGVAARFEDELDPAIPRVWNDAIDGMRADLREWLRRLADDTAWTPFAFELSFGLTHRDAADPASRDEAILLDNGLRLRGAIDMVERGPGRIRVTDHKTGKVRVKESSIVEGGKALQPVLYALAAEKIYPDAEIASSRLWYCTSAGAFVEREMPFDQRARDAGDRVIGIISDHLQKGSFPAAPEDGACRFCNYRAVCGPHEEVRTKKKPRKQIEDVLRIRQMP